MKFSPGPSNSSIEFKNNLNSPSSPYQSCFVKPSGLTKFPYNGLIGSSISVSIVFTTDASTSLLASKISCESSSKNFSTLNSAFSKSSPSNKTSIALRKRLNSPSSPYQSLSWNPSGLTNFPSSEPPASISVLILLIIDSSTILLASNLSCLVGSSGVLKIFSTLNSTSSNLVFSSSPISTSIATKSFLNSPLSTKLSSLSYCISQTTSFGIINIPSKLPPVSASVSILLIIVASITLLAKITSSSTSAFASSKSTVRSISSSKFVKPKPRSAFRVLTNSPSSPYHKSLS